MMMLIVIHLLRIHFLTNYCLEDHSLLLLSIFDVIVYPERIKVLLVKKNASLCHY
jgi:hypothetical protein